MCNFLHRIPTSNQQLAPGLCHDPKQNEQQVIPSLNVVGSILTARPLAWSLCSHLQYIDATGAVGSTILLYCSMFHSCQVPLLQHHCCYDVIALCNVRFYADSNTDFSCTIFPFVTLCSLHRLTPNKVYSLFSSVGVKLCTRQISLPADEQLSSSQWRSTKLCIITKCHGLLDLLN